MFNVGYMDLSYEEYIDSTDRYNEIEYVKPVVIRGIIYGDKQYNRDLEESNTVSGYTCQTLNSVNVKDKINGYIVTKVNKHYDIFGIFDYWEVSLNNG